MTTQDQLVPGAVIRTNYNTGPYTVARVTVIDGLIYIATTGGQYLNDYVTLGGRIVKSYAYPLGSCGYHSNGGGLNGDGRDEVFIAEPAPAVPTPKTGRKVAMGQLSLFEGGI